MNTDNIRDDMDSLKNGVASLIADREALTELRYLLEPYREDYHPPGTEKNRRETDRELVGRIGSRAAAFPRERTDALLADREALLALRKVLDGHRKMQSTLLHNGNFADRTETDEEVIARLGSCHYAPLLGASVEDETGRPLGKIAGRNRDMCLVVNTHDAVGRSYADGHVAGRASVSPPPVGTTVTDQHCHILGFLQHWSAGSVVVASVKPQPLTDRRREELRAAGRKAHARGGKRVDMASPFPASLDEILELQSGWDEADASVRGIAPKPIRLHAGQVWEKDGYENVIQQWQPQRPGQHMLYLPYKDCESHWLEVDADSMVVNANGWRLVAGPGFAG